MATPPTESTLTIGLIGAGNIGLAVAGRLRSLGHDVTVFDASPAALDRAVQLGCHAAKSGADVARACPVILLSLPNPVIVKAVAGELVGQAYPGRVIVDLSTNDPQTARTLAEAAQAQSIAYLDAPVSGGPSRARTGELTTMVGGDQAAFERARPVLSGFAKQVEYAGASGSGAVAKLLNNFIAIWGMIGVSQAFLAAEALGVSQQRLYEIMAKSSARSYSLDRNFPKIRDRNFAPDFSLDLAEKDMRLGVQLLNDAGYQAFAQDQLKLLFDRSAENGGGAKDIAAMVEALGSMLAHPPH